MERLTPMARIDATCRIVVGGLSCGLVLRVGARCFLVGGAPSDSLFPLAFQDIRPQTERQTGRQEHGIRVGTLGPVLFPRAGRTGQR